MIPTQFKLLPASLVSEPHLRVGAETVSPVEETLADIAGLVAIAVLDPHVRTGQSQGPVAVGQGTRQPHSVAVVLGVKVLRPHRLSEHDVVIEILREDKVKFQVGNRSTE